MSLVQKKEDLKKLALKYERMNNEARESEVGREILEKMMVLKDEIRNSLGDLGGMDRHILK